MVNPINKVRAINLYKISLKSWHKLILSIIFVKTSNSLEFSLVICKPKITGLDFCYLIVLIKFVNKFWCNVWLQIVKQLTLIWIPKWMDWNQNLQ